MNLMQKLSRALPRATPQITAWMGFKTPSAPNEAPSVPSQTQAAAPSLETLLVIPEHTNPQEDILRRSSFEKGQFLARQERWEDLARLIAAEDRARSLSPGGMPIAELLAQGARGDVVAMAEHVLFDGSPEEARPLAEAISALETILGEMPNHHVIAAIVANAHLDIAWAWRGTGPTSQTPARNLEAFELHCARARQVLDPFCGLELDSPLVTATRCALLVCEKDAAARAADDYEDLIDLAPHHSRHIRAMGRHLLPQWFGSYETLDLEARRTAARTEDVWGAGAYSWAYFDAILMDPNCAAGLDVTFFLDGMKDILARAKDQHEINMLAAFTAVSIPNAQKTVEVTPEARKVLEQIGEATRWIMSDYLHELHPLVWGHAEAGFDNHARIASLDALSRQGRAHANKTVMRFFGEHIRKGHTLIFTPRGLYVQPA